MRITVINGQNHKGSSYHIGRLLADQFSDAEISEFFLPRDLNHFCLGCYSCIENEEKCPCYSEKRAIMEKIEASDLLIFTTPTYCMRASAPMKAFIDLNFINWMAHRPQKCMFSKKAVVISTAAGAGTKSAMKDITTALLYWGVPYVKTYGISVQAACWEDVKENKKQKISADMVKLAAKMKKAKVKAGLKTKGIFAVMRLMQVKNMGSGEADRSYWEKQGWLGKGRPWKA